MTTEQDRRLILKAARRYDRETSEAKSTKAAQVAEARLDAFGEVASDILGVCMTTFAFSQAIKTTLRQWPQPMAIGAGVHRNQALRAIWETKFVEAFYTNLI